MKDIFENRFLDDDYEHFKLHPFVKDKLHSYQHLHVSNLITSIKHNNIAMDGSATGTGKTYTAIALCRQLRLKPIIFCTIGTRSVWKMVCNKFDVEPIAIVNYELIRNCKVYDKDGKKIPSEFLKKNEKKQYVWNVTNSKNTIVIYDEVHKCKSSGTLLGKLLISNKHQCKILMLSATLCDKPNDFLIFGYMMGFYNRLRAGKTWIKGILREEASRVGKHKYSVLSSKLFPEKGSRMMIEDIGDAFPKNNVVADSYDIDSKYISVINNSLKDIKNSLKKGKKLVEINKARQEIEKIKIPIIMEQIEKYYDMNMSVVVFVNFIDTLDILSTLLTKAEVEYSILQGGQDKDTRERNIEMFQYNRHRVILCTIQTGGESISLHDKTGKYPRVSIISPSFSSIDLVQALGRIYRSDVKSPCLQRLIFCANTYEDNICNIINDKSGFINKLSDEDLITF
jgi:superfamily II DNA or RNA helicase